MAPAGDITITAMKVDILEARETSHNQTETKFKQSGLTVAVTSPVITAIQTAQQMSQAASNTSDIYMCGVFLTADECRLSGDDFAGRYTRFGSETDNRCAALPGIRDWQLSGSPTHCRSGVVRILHVCR